ncbi:glycoside hydrolase family 92 protein [Chitinophaga sp. G-6-1-13]|uniref:Glycoside hydrolase family 92 protein n=1 Tax=Chitinophaga fulva TaxID=2728842 RepID=A0A848GPX4_9BACT|nr:GH92 family glycosyl hydrolase [Chitinophaga fulva]NML39601.1 glycoside hydrolase family 92 protein [Chitinophaga fulva]
MLKKIFILFLLAALALQSNSQTANKRLVDEVNPFIDTHKSRWFFFSSACRPFGMVSLSPDTWALGSWNSGYLYDSSYIRCFSHVHCWEISGIPVMATTGAMKGQLGFEAVKSKFTHDKEIAKPGYHKVVLDDYGITAELTSTCRTGFHRYTFPASDTANILLDIGATLGQGRMDSAFIQVENGSQLSGYSVMAPTSRRKKTATVYFVAQFNQPFSKFGGWKKTGTAVTRTLLENVQAVSGKEAGGYVTFYQPSGPVLLKVGISFTSIEQARLNLQSELPHWNFDQVVNESYSEWDTMLGKIKVEGGTEKQRIKFYTDLWHSLLGRHIYSDVNGQYADNTGPATVIRHIPTDQEGKPLFNVHNSDGFWGSEWNLNILWSIAYPKVMSDMISTLVEYYKNAGLIARGPSGGNYTFVMSGDQAIPMIAAAYNKGIRSFDVEAAYKGSIKNASPGGIRDHVGYELPAHPYMQHYISSGYVPEGIDGKQMHREGCALTLYFAYQDWCMAQFAKGKGMMHDYQYYLQRSFSYRNVFDSSAGWMRPRELDGSWMKDFTPVSQGFNARGFIESNAAIYTYYVPHNIPDLIQLLGGNEKFAAKLQQQFEKAAPYKFVVPHGHHAEGWLDYENQPSLHMAHLFNYCKKPWLTQYWVRRIKEECYGDTTPYGGYNGDEDQGQVGALGVLMATGLFDVEGGASVNPHYEITSPIFDKVTIQLDQRYYPGKTFVITTINNKPGNNYIQSARLNGKPLTDFRFPHSTLIKGGTLQITLGATPNEKWGIGK